MTAIRSFSAHNVDLISINQLEMFLPGDVDLGLLEEARSIVGSLPAFWEAPAERAERTIALLTEHNSNADHPTFGYKMRTGGVTADAFPTSAQIAPALVAPATQQVPIKFTAGLHHPLATVSRGSANEDARVSECAGRGRAGGGTQWDAAQTAAMLEDEDVSFIQVR